MRPYVRDLARKSPFYVSAYPNAGLPNEMGEYDESPEEMGKQLEDFMKNNLVNIVGGCCGTTPDHIKAIAEAVAGIEPRKTPKLVSLTKLSGLEPITIRPDSNFVNVGERTNVTGSARFQRLIKEDNYEEALSVARQQIENGAQVIDVNIEYELLD